VEPGKAFAVVTYSAGYIGGAERRARMSFDKVFFGMGLRCILILALVISSRAVLADNSAFLGTFDMTVSGTEPNRWTESERLKIGSTQSRMAEEGYIHVPSSGDRVTNAWTKEGGAPVDQVVTITADTIMVDESRKCFNDTGTLFLCVTKDMRFAFADDYTSAVISGTIWSADPTDDQGTVTGSLKRVATDGGGGGGCLISATMVRLR
jgi:hypothetical protein